MQTKTAVIEIIKEITITELTDITNYFYKNIDSPFYMFS